MPDDQLIRVGKDDGLIDFVNDFRHYTVQRRIFRRAPFFLATVIAIDKEGNGCEDQINTQTDHAYDISRQCGGDRDGGEYRQKYDTAHNADPSGNGYLTRVTDVLFLFHKSDILS